MYDPCHRGGEVEMCLPPEIEMLAPLVAPESETTCLKH